MARRRREASSLFSFSFVDILATTIGVLIFIMVLVLLNSSKRVSASGLQDQVDRTAQEARQRQEQAGKLTERAEAERKQKEAYETGTATEGAALLDRRQQEEKRNELRGAARALKSEADALKRQVQALRTQAEQTAKKIEQIKKTPDRVETKRTKVEFRVPKLRGTTKKPYTFECDNGRIYFLATYQGGINTRNYSKTSLGIAVLLKRKNDAIGETLSGALAQNSHFMGQVRGMSTGRHFANLIVRPSGFGVFRGIRKAMWRRGYDINWRAYSAGESLIVGTGGGGGHQVQ